MIKEIEVTFDQYQRYKFTQDIIEYYRKDADTTFSILEVGSNESKNLRKFLPNDSILFTDIELNDAQKADPEFACADATNLSYADDEFDFIVATDVLEHLDNTTRIKMINEISRVSKLAVILTFPHGDTCVEAAERRCNVYYRSLFNEDFIWLKQHEEMGLPKISEVDNLLSQTNYESFHMVCGNLNTWETMNYSMFNAVRFPQLWPFHCQLDQYYIQNLFYGDIYGDCYRAIYVISNNNLDSLKEHLLELHKDRNDSKLPHLNSLIHAQDSAEIMVEYTNMLNDLNEKKKYIEVLEAANAEVHKNWAANVDQWKLDLQQWRSEAATWTAKENELNSRIEQLNSEHNTLVNELQAQISLLTNQLNAKEADLAAQSSEKNQYMTQYNELISTPAGKLALKLSHGGTEK